MKKRKYSHNNGSMAIDELLVNKERRVIKKKKNLESY
jgi:phosphoribosyl-dephospho-CoA transferase